MQEEGHTYFEIKYRESSAIWFDAPNEIVRDMIVNVRDSEGYSDSKGIFLQEKRLNNIAN